MQRQIKYRRAKRDVECSKAMESEKQRLKYIECEIAKESIRRKLAKQLEHEENLKFFEYTQQVKCFKNELELKAIVADCHRTNDKPNETAAAEHAKQKQMLKDGKRVRNES